MTNDLYGKTAILVPYSGHTPSMYWLVNLKQL